MICKVEINYLGLFIPLLELLNIPQDPCLLYREQIHSSGREQPTNPWHSEL